MTAIAMFVAVSGAAWTQTVGFTPGLDSSVRWDKLDDSTIDRVADDISSVLATAMDLLYEKGYIITDDVVTFLSKDGYRDLGYGMDNAERGGIDFLVCIRFVFVTSPVRDGPMVLSDVEYRIVRVADGAVLADERIEGCIPASINDASIKASLAVVGREIGTKCIETLAGPK